MNPLLPMSLLFALSVPSQLLAAPATVAETARRLSDGSLFVPKPMQRQLAIATQRSSNDKVAQTITLAGHLIPAGDASGVVQAPQIGTLHPAGNGLPKLGQRVRQGETLAWLIPEPNAADRASIEAGLAEANGRKRQAEQDLARLTALRPHITQQQLDTLAVAVATEQGRIAAYRKGLARQPLKSPIDGSIAAVKAVSGQVVDARETLFEIVDSRRMWLEVTAFDPSLRNNIAAAHAITPDGQTFDLQWLGSGAVLREQALPIQFRLVGDASSQAIGTQVEVQIHSRQTQSGSLLPASAVTRDNAGNQVVWAHTAAEIFAPLRVKPIPAHAGKVIVTGLPDKARIVVRGAELLAQIR